MHRGFRREFIGFNRARHAVLEAAIYATRLHLLPRPFVESELARLQVIVDKTAGPHEIEAMALLTRHVRETTTRDDTESHMSGTVFVEAPARLHFGVLDLRGSLGRWFGGVGTAAPGPTLLVSASPAATLEVTGEDADRAAEFARRFLAYHRVSGGASICVHRALPRHSGLGSGTQLALAVARALARAVRSARRGSGSGDRDRAGEPFGDRHLDVRRRRTGGRRRATSRHARRCPVARAVALPVVMAVRRRRARRPVRHQRR